MANSSKADWSGLTVYLVPVDTALRTQAELSAVTANGSATVGGFRIVAPGDFVRLPDLAAGESASYRLSLPIRDLGLTEGNGVYQLGVEVLGSGPEGYDTQADGRASTFLPVMGRRAATAEVSIVVPFRATVARAVDGSVVNAPRWVRSASPGGRLYNVLAFSLQADLPVNLMVDPAVLDAIGSVSAGNPANGNAGSPGADPTAAGWLESFAAIGHRSTVLALPYGDVDAGAAVDNGMQDVLSVAEQLSRSVLSDYPAVPVIAPISGSLTPAQLRGLAAVENVLLGSRALPDVGATTVNARTGPGLTLTNSSLDALATQGDSLTPLRQALLAELAIRSLSGLGDAPLVISFPARWRAPGVSASRAFFSGLEQPWVSGASFPRAAPSDPVIPDGRLTVPADTPRTVPLTNFVVAGELLQSSAALAELTSAPGVVDSGQRQALLAVSANLAGKPGPAVTRTNGALAEVTNQLQKVSLSGPNFVTMSSGTGSFQVTITNGLDQDVVVGLSSVVSSADLTVKPIDPVTVSAGQQRSIRVTVTSHHLGVYRVTLHPVTASGIPLPSSLILSVRGSQIGQIIWVILAAAAGLLFFTIGMRMVRRIRGRRG